MSDTMTTGEIEDVLSSIRRLVSDDNRLVFRAVPRPPMDGEKLILTPALRVASPMPAETEADIPEVETTRIGSVVTAIAAAVPPPADGWEPEAGDAFGATDTVASLPEEWDVAEAESGATVLTLAVGAMRTRPAMAEAIRDTDPAPEQDSEAEPEPDTAPTATDPITVEAEPDAAALTEEAAEEEEWGDYGPDARPNGWRPDGAAPETVLRAEAEAASTPADPAAPLADAETLRAIVREVLREELQGQLGERITRNVRKLVRAEIARAMSAQAAE